MDDEINEKDLEDIDENDLLDELNALALGNDEQSDDLILKQLEDECDSNITSDTIPNDFCDVAILSDPMSDKLLAPSDSDPITVPSQKTIPSNLMTDKLLVLSQRQQEYTAFALHLKNTGNAPSAREMLSIAKKIQIALENQNHAFIIPPPPSSLKIKQNSAVITSIPNRVVNPVESKQISSPKLIQSVPVTEDAWQFLQTNLESQIKLCTKIASSHLQNNRKDEAVKFHIQKKLCVAWLDSIKALQKTPNSICPQFHFSTINYEIQDIQDDVPTDQIEVSISKVWDLDVSKAGGCDGDLHAVIVFGFPNDDKPSRFQSPILKYDANVDFKFAKTIPIERSKQFQRFLERKKLIIEVYSTRPKTISSYFIGNSSMCIAKAHIKLDSLLTGSMIDLVTDLCDANISRKSVPGKMELKIRIRSPLLKCGLVTKTEKWLIVDFKDGNLVSHISQNSSVENDTLNQTIVSQKSASPSKSSISSPQVSKNPTENNSKSSVADIEDLIISFDNPDTISSNHVLETEYNSIVSSINLKRDISPDILDLKQAYEIRMNILVSLVQTGTFTFESYIKGLEESAEVYKTLALKFKESNRADYARKSLVRMKLIKEEIKNMAEETS